MINRLVLVGCLVCSLVACGSGGGSGNNGGSAPPVVIPPPTPTVNVNTPTPTLVVAENTPVTIGGPRTLVWSDEFEGAQLDLVGGVGLVPDLVSHARRLVPVPFGEGLLGVGVGAHAPAGAARSGR